MERVWTFDVYQHQFGIGCSDNRVGTGEALQPENKVTFAQWQL